MQPQRNENLPDKPLAKDGTRRGRPRSANTRLTRVRAHEIAMSGHAPIDVMYQNMLFWHEKALGAEQQVFELIEKGTADLTVDDRKLMIELLRTLLGARSQSQNAAVDLAPYIHPKLSSITLKGDPKNPLTMVASEMSPQQAAEAYATTLRNTAAQIIDEDGNPVNAHETAEAE